MDDSPKRLRNNFSGYTDGVSAVAESKQPYEQSDEKRVNSNTIRLNDAEREALLTAADLLIGSRPGATLRNLLERMK